VLDTHRSVLNKSRSKKSNTPNEKTYENIPYFNLQRCAGMFRGRCEKRQEIKESTAEE